MSYQHVSVLHDEVIVAMAVRPDGHYVDATYGRGGHASSILAGLDARGRLVVMDRDPQAIADACKKMGNDARVTIVHDDYTALPQLIAASAMDRFDGVLLDLGVSSPQLDDAGRGFSFQQSGPLDMRMDPARGQSAAEWLALADDTEIARVLWEYGEERHSRRIARRIVERRKTAALKTTTELAQLIADAVPRTKHNRHPATRSFQAIRIHINQELTQLSRLLDAIFGILKIGGRLLVISFHSLEDRLVKRFLRMHSTPPKLPRGLPLPADQINSEIRLKTLGKAIRASAAELATNPRARSAVLRVAERAA